MVRASLTPDEWRQIRKLAIDRNTTTSQLVGDTLRKGLLKPRRARS